MDDETREQIRWAAEQVDVSEWRSLDSTERQLIRDALVFPPNDDSSVA